MSGQESDIVITGWSARYKRAVDRLLRIEGGFVNDPVDRGGATKYGISLRFLVAEGALDLDGDGRKDFDLDFDGDIDGIDVRKLTVGDARFLYHRCFWKRLAIEGLPQPIGEMVFDQAVNGGGLAAGKLLQRALQACGASKLVIDGDISVLSRAALHGVIEQPDGMLRLIAAFREAVKARYRSIASNNPSQARFLKGWLRRADELGRGW